ncbi:hypothetical protein ACFPC0_10695 [Streptomyces andamanensis]|uniref:Uncharacterized protein n=1 Tax=Streptomyces andamanensis TaxID=1565035 RepID=A0ABV8TCP0_9ACTN
MMTDTPEPAYWRVDNDAELLYSLDGLNEDEVVHSITGDQPVDPMDTGEDFLRPLEAARATPDELTQWHQAHASLKLTVFKADEALEAARAAWEAAQKAHHNVLKAAWEAYEPTDRVIAGRRDEVNEMRDKAEQELREAAQEAKDKEDAELGPRTWVTYEPNVALVKNSPDMAVPVIHLAGCKVTEGREDYTYKDEYRYARKDDVEVVLLKGAPRYARGRATPDRLPTKLCGRCKPHESLHEALGETYEEWRRELESIQEPAPTHAGMAGVLGLKDEWRRYKTDGYTVTSSTYYREENLIEPYEELIGWYDGEREVVVPNEEKLARLEEILPGRGFAVRRVKSPAAFHTGKEWSDTAVAVRRLTKAEKRQRKEDAAATARFRGQPG